MRKYLKVLTAIFLLTGCSRTKSQSSSASPSASISLAPSVPVVEVTAESISPSRDPSELGSKIIKDTLNVYASVMAETFGASFSNSRMPEKITVHGDWYKVLNYQTIADLKKHVSEYLTGEALADALSSIGNNFQEEDGSLYFVQQARGYGYYGIDPTQWEKVDDSTVSVQFTILGEHQEDQFCTVNYFAGIRKLDDQ